MSVPIQLFQFKISRDNLCRHGRAQNSSYVLIRILTARVPRLGTRRHVVGPSDSCPHGCGAGQTTQTVCHLAVHAMPHKRIRPMEGQLLPFHRPCVVSRDGLHAAYPRVPFHGMDQVEWNVSVPRPFFSGVGGRRALQSSSCRH